MLFSSLEFLYAFLPASLALYYLAPRSLKNGVLLLLSLVFYYYGEQNRICLLLLAVAASYLGALRIERWRGTKRARLWLVATVAFDLLLLAIFKYTDFVLSSINDALGASLSLTGILLPVGISFYTFQALSYVVDVYRGSVRVQKNPLTLATYIALFPQLIAGPIVRYSDVECELEARTHCADLFTLGARRFVLGLGKKVLIANVLFALCADFRALEQPSFVFYWLYAAAYALHLYFDFSGYSDMAVGLGNMFGFHFPENFRYPFAASSISDFWRRWHITLGSWLRDYVYFPLGGSRVSKRKQVRNLFVVWLLTGLWHGAAWNFVLWGLLFGVLIGGEKLLCGNAFARLPRIVRHALILPLLLVSFVVFDARSLAELGGTLRGLFGLGGAAFIDGVTLYCLRSYGPTLLAAAALSLGTLPALRVTLEKTRWWQTLRAVLAPCAMAAILIASTAFLVDGSYNPFLYFRF